MRMSFGRSLILAVTVFTFVTLAWAQTTNPKPLNPHKPDYPVELADSGQDGEATIEALVRVDGTVTDAVVIAADHPAFGTAAVAAIQVWKFQPGTRNGAPVDMKVSVPFQFRAPFEQKINAQAKRKVYLVLPEPALSAREYVSELKVKNDARAVYPNSLIRSGVIANVTVNFVVAPDGSVLNPRFYSPPRVDLLMPTLAAVARMTFEPPVKDGKPVYVEASTTLHFEESTPGRAGRGQAEGGGSAAAPGDKAVGPSP
ncbi:MAG: TonB family protein [Opitutus sp.]|nr:TonB family protein [Opitutus sp.]